MSEQTLTKAASEKMSEELLSKLRRVGILSSLSDERLSCLAGVQEIHLGSGEFLARQGEMAHNFWILMEGELRIYQAQADGHEMTMATIDAGSSLGELPLLSNIPYVASVVTTKPSHLMQLNEEEFWNLMTTCPEVRKAILGNMAQRLQKLQGATLRQEKMAALGTLAAGLMHELNNPGTAASRAAAQLRDNLMRMHTLAAKFSKTPMNEEQKQCMVELQEQALNTKHPKMMNSLEQSDAEDALVEWMEGANIDNAWKLAPTLVSIGLDSEQLECAREEFPGPVFSDALNWLEAMVSSMQLVGTIEESIGRVGDLVKAVKAYAYEGKNQRQDLDVNASIHATLVMLGHKLREKEVVLEKELATDMPLLHTECSGLNQIWTNLMDNAIDAVGQRGHIKIKTWVEKTTGTNGHTDLCISIKDNGSGIPLESQPHIFDPFYTTKPVGVGTGLGLGIVHRIVDQFGGTIRFSSDNDGTEFVVRLPQRITEA